MEKITSLSRDDLLRILNHSFDEIFVTDANGVVVYVNASCVNHYGQQYNEMVGKRSKELTAQNLWGPRLSPLAKQYKKRLTMKQLSCTGITMLTTASPVFNKNGEVDFVIENVRNVTEGEGIKEEMADTQIFLNQLEESIEENMVEELTIENFIANSKVMKNIIKMSWRIAEVNSNVLITGDSGAGKSIIARYIHGCSPRNKGPFIEINCAALPEALIESELFGYVRGAFSGAVSKGKKGLIQTAENGTLFLDEIGELPVSVQAKLLRFIQDGTYFEVGGTSEKKADCRIIAATNRNLPDMVSVGKFRQDLYYRLKVFEINIPPLVERKDDIIPLVNFFLKKYNDKYRLNKQISQDCVDVLLKYNWPGNVRELSNVMEQLVVMCTDATITEKYLPRSIRENDKISALNINKDTENHNVDLDALSYKEGMDFVDSYADEMRCKIIRAMYIDLKSSRKIAATLNISQSSAYRFIKEYCKDLMKN
ncbi:MAG: sigma 54-interacting transcriptional regulator [Clostridiales bacterium]